MIINNLNGFSVVRLESSQHGYRSCRIFVQPLEMDNETNVVCLSVNCMTYAHQ